MRVQLVERATEALIAAPYDWRTYAPSMVARVVLMAASGATDEEIDAAVMTEFGDA